MTSEPDSSIQFAYGAAFSRNLYACLSSVEFRALKLLLEAEPEIGAKLRGSRNSRGLDYCGCMVYYSYEPIFEAELEAHYQEVLRARRARLRG